MKTLNLFLSLILILVMGTVASAQTIDAVKSIRMNMTGTNMGKEIAMEVTIVMSVAC